jgi:hypothetical protein
MDNLTIYLAAAAFTLAVAYGKAWSKEQRRKATEKTDRRLRRESWKNE